jgi:hypothetical protein
VLRALTNSLTIEYETVAAVDQIVIFEAAASSKGEAHRRYAVGRVQHNLLVDAHQDAKEGWLPVVHVQPPVELGVGDEASPGLANYGGAREGGGLRREAEEDLPQEIVIFKWGGRRSRRGVVAQSSALLTRMELGMQARAGAAGHSVSNLTRLDLRTAARAALVVHSGDVLTGVDLGWTQPRRGRVE